MNEAMKEAFVKAGVNLRAFPKGKKISRQKTKPLVIETRQWSMNGELRRGRICVQDVKHIVRMGGEFCAVTITGDIWKFRNEGNKFLRAI